jgi:predicted amino acid dehydrogenase
MKPIKLILTAFRDLIIRFLPNFNEQKYSFAFLVHPRNIEDTYRKYPFFKLFSQKFLLWFLRHFWPVVLSKVEGLRSLKSEKKIDGYVITIPLIAHQMMEDRELAKKKIVQAIELAEKLGAKIVGLGALTSSVTKGGLDLVDEVNINITTGHAYTSYNVTKNLFDFIKKFNVDKNKTLVAIVGATGSIGSTSAQLIARNKINNLLLIDLERKSHLFNDLIKKLREINNNVKIKISHQIGDIKNADFVVTATNAPETLIKSDDLRSGAIIIDDAQPSDVSPEVLDRDDVLVIEGGIVRTPSINSHFNFGLKSKYDNFSCMAEILVLASQEWSEHYVINKASLDLVDEISNLALKLGFDTASPQNFKESIKEEKINNIKRIIQGNK